MSVTDASRVDVIGVELSSGCVVLTVADHLDWLDPSQHLHTLQAKLKTYIGFIESGELFAVYPAAVGREVRIDVAFREEPAAQAESFLAEVKSTLRGVGIGFTWRTQNRAREN